MRSATYAAIPRHRREPLRTLGALLLATTASANDLPLELGAYAWQPEYDGNIRVDNGTADINDGLGFDDDSAAAIYLVWRHDHSKLPVLKLQYTRIDTSAHGAALTDFTLNGVSFPDGTPLATDLDLSHLDATFFYPLLEGRFAVDLGFAFRWIDGSLELTSGDANANKKIEATLPLIYAAGRANLPRNFYIGADVAGISADGQSLLDYRVNAGWHSQQGLGLEIGLRHFDIDKETVDLTLDGPYIAVEFNH